MQRYALYWAPRPDSALAAFGRAWLGADPETGEPTRERDPSAWTRSWWSAQPRLPASTPCTPR